MTISCLLVLSGQLGSVSAAIRQFEEQDYPERELVILDALSLAGLVDIPASPWRAQLRLADQNTDGELSVGVKRNLGCRQAREPSKEPPRFPVAEVSSFTLARAEHLALPEFAAFNTAVALPYMRHRCAVPGAAGGGDDRTRLHGHPDLPGGGDLETEVELRFGNALNEPDGRGAELGVRAGGGYRDRGRGRRNVRWRRVQGQALLQERTSVRGVVGVESARSGRGKLSGAGTQRTAARAPRG